MKIRRRSPIHRLWLILAGSSLVILTVFFGVALAVEGDVVFKRSSGHGGNPPAVFPHWVHRVRYKCYACHPAPFRMKAGANQVSMDLIQQGKSCGVCHNGKRAWGITFDTCNRCHVGQ
jgi:c(7)-type cytochrome triheme protein